MANVSSDLISQGFKLALHLEKRFNWAELVNSAVSAGMSRIMNIALPGADFLPTLEKQAVINFMTEGVQSAIDDVPFQMDLWTANVIGNTIGISIGQAISRHYNERAQREAQERRQTVTAFEKMYNDKLYVAEQYNALMQKYAASKPVSVPVSHVPEVPNSQAFSQTRRTGNNPSRFFMTGGQAQTSSTSISNQRWQQRAEVNGVHSQVRQSVHNHVTGRNTSLRSISQSQFLRETETSIWESDLPLLSKFEQSAEAFLYGPSYLQDRSHSTLGGDILGGSKQLGNYAIDAVDMLTGGSSGLAPQFRISPNERYGAATIGIFGTLLAARDGGELEVEGSPIRIPETSKPLNEIGPVSSDALNQKYISEGYHPPYDSNYRARNILLERSRTFVRVHGEDNQVSKWMMRAGDIDGLTPLQIKDKFALEFLPSYVSEVNLPANTLTRLSVAGPQSQWDAVGGGFQYELLQRIPMSSFTNRMPIYQPLVEPSSFYEESINWQKFVRN
jgi:hypothetical protein